MLKRDQHSKAVVSTDKKALQQFRYQRKLERRIAALEKQVAALTEIINKDNKN